MFSGKRRLAIEMFKAKHMLNNRLSQHVKITESKRNGKLMEIPGKNLELVETLRYPDIGVRVRVVYPYT